MDTLFISNKTRKRLLKYCSEALITEVLEDFAKKGEIVVNDTFEKPVRGFLTADYWVITDYIKDDTIEYRKKVAVILSFAATGAFIHLGDESALCDVNTLLMLKETGNISEEDFDYFVEAFFNFAMDEGVKFVYLQN